MKQRAHAWSALRALKLLDDSKKAPKLVELLSYYLSDAWEGAWLPDTLIVDMRYGHIYKMDSSPDEMGFNIKKEKWLAIPYNGLKSKLKGKRLLLNYIKGADELNKPYRSHADKGGHLPNRIIALSHTVSDMSKMSDYPLAFYAKKEKSSLYQKDLSAQSVKDLSLSPNFSARQIALTLFMLSHYICDAHMPLHCDLRDYGTKGRRLPRDLHPSIEEEWERHFPVKEDIVLHEYKKQSIDSAVAALPKESIIKIDRKKEYSLSRQIPLIKQDEWQEMVYICRVSYAAARRWIDRPYRNVKELISGRGEKEFERVTNYIFHDVVQSIAAIWLKAWKKFIK